MLFDRTTIAVRERSPSEIADISLHVLRDHFQPLMLTLGLLVLPAMILNYLLIGWMTDINYSDNNLLGYAWNMIMLVVIESQIVTLFATHYLGQALFAQNTTWREAVKTVFDAKWRILLCHGIVRAALPVLGLYWIVAVYREGDFINFLLFAVIPLGVTYAMFVRGLRPFITELLILERCPFRSRGATSVTLSVRSRTLHFSATGDLIGRGLLQTVLAILMTSVMFGSVLTIWNVFAAVRWDSPVLSHVLFPLCLWITVGILFVNRFLNYLDIRTRQEGWEVELQLRAEAAKLNKQFNFTSGEEDRRLGGNSVVGDGIVKGGVRG